MAGNLEEKREYGKTRSHALGTGDGRRLWIEEEAVIHRLHSRQSQFYLVKYLLVINND